MSTGVAERTEAPPLTGSPHLRWWREVAFIVGFYGIYSLVRNQFGSAAVSPQAAFANARDVMDIQEAVGLHFEEDLQDVFLGVPWFIQALNVFYGTFHFVVTAFALVYLYRLMPQRYVRWRTTLACTTALALVGFATFPLMPPRLLPASYGYVDTLAEFGGTWSFDSGTMRSISNQYAAMPSLHFAWSTWSTFVLLPAIRRRWVRVIVVAYPLATLFAIMVTANHFWLDAVGGAVALAVGYLIGTGWDRWSTARRQSAARRRSAGASPAAQKTL